MKEKPKAELKKAPTQPGKRTHDSKNKIEQHLGKLIKQQSIIWKIMKNSKFVFYLKNLNPIKLKSINDKIRKSVEERHHRLPNNFLTFLGKEIHKKYLN